MHDQTQRLARALDRTISDSRAELARLADRRHAAHAAAERSTKELEQRWRRRAAAIRRRAADEKANVDTSDYGQPGVMSFGPQEPDESGNPLDELVRADERRDERAATATPLAEVRGPRYGRRDGDAAATSPGRRRWSR